MELPPKDQIHLCSDPIFIRTPWAFQASKVHKHLFLAVKYGFTDQVHSILASNLGLNVDACFTECGVYTSPIHIAVERGDPDIVKRLILAGSSLDLTDGNGYRPIHLAASRNNEDIFLMLVTAGARTGLIDPVSKLPLHYLLKSPQVSPITIKYLLDLHIDNPIFNNWRIPKPNRFVNPLTIAIRYSSLEVLKTLIYHPTVDVVNVYRSFNVLSFAVVSQMMNPRRWIPQLSILMTCIEARYGRNELLRQLNLPSNATGMANEPLYTLMNVLCWHLVPIDRGTRTWLIKELVIRGSRCDWVRLPRFMHSALVDIDVQPNLIGSNSPICSCVNLADWNSVKVLILNGEVLHPFATFRSTVYLSKVNFYGFRILSAALSSPWGFVQESDIFPCQESRQLYLKWTKQPRSLRHLARKSWLNQKPRVGENSKDFQVISSDLPTNVKRYLLLDDHSDF